MVEQSGGLVAYHQTWDLERFLKNNKPSRITNPNKFWVSVARPLPLEELRLVGAHRHSLEVAAAQAQQCWNQLTREHHELCADDIKAIAQATGHVVGRWSLQRAARAADDVWERIAKATTEGRLGQMSKITTSNSAQGTLHKKHIIHVYTENYTDHSDVYRVLDELRALGLGGVLTYRPDVYTLCGVYANNTWGICPVLYESRPPNAAEEAQ